MNCPECGGNSGIIETRVVEHGTRRRHKCLFCYHRFTTMEIAMDEYKYLTSAAKNKDQFFTVVKKIEGLFKDHPTEKGGVQE